MVVGVCSVTVVGSLVVLAMADSRRGAVAATATGIALIAALVALVMTVARAKAGADLDEKQIQS